MPPRLSGVQRIVRGAALGPFWMSQLLTGAKSFMDNPIIGSKTLNQYGLHAMRVRAAHHMAWSRRARLAHLISDGDRAAFDRDGFVLRSGFLPPAVFAALLEQIRRRHGSMREQVQGGSVTRRIALSPDVLADLPSARSLLADPVWRGLIRYAGSFDAEPLTYIQTIMSDAVAGTDPQCEVHADTFHPSVKAWLFLTDVAEDEGPFTYVPGSHRLTPERLEWEQRMSVSMSDATSRLTQRGSFRVSRDELTTMNLPQPRKFAVSANTLVVADTYGFHARGASARPTQRVEVFASGRRNPFLPWTGLDPWQFEALGQRRMPIFWAMGDALQAAGLKHSLWRARNGSAFDPVPHDHHH